jgi:hypothetical protein
VIVCPIRGERFIDSIKVGLSSRRLCGSICGLWRPFIAHVLEPVRAAILAVQPSLSVSEAALGAALAFRRVGAIEERNVLVANILEPGKVLACVKATFKDQNSPVNLFRIRK